MRESSRTRHILRRIARWTITTCVIVAPWLFACADSWIFLFMCLPIMAGTAIWLICTIAYPQSGIRMPVVTLLLLLFLALILIQAAPMPTSIVKVVSPLAAETTQTQFELFEQMGIESEVPQHAQLCDKAMSISISPSSTMISFYLMCSYVGIFLVMLNTIRTWIHVKRTVYTILSFGFVLSVISIIHSFSDTHDIFWFHTPRYGGNVFGPFTNRNHYAFHMIMIFSLALAMLMASLRFMLFRWDADWREKLAELSTTRASRLALLAFVMIMTGASICLSLSRGAITSLVIALGITCIIEARHHRDNKAKNIIIPAIFLIIAGVVIWLGWQPVVNRIGSLSDIAADPLANARSIATIDSLKIFGASPLFGSGFGTFRYTFPMFQSESIQFGRFLHAHNDWIQLLAEGGIISGVLTGLILILFIREILEKRKYSIHVSWVFVRWMAVAFIGVSLHSMVDYSLHKPANAMMLSALLGLSAAAIHIAANDQKPLKRSTYERNKRKQLLINITRPTMTLMLAGIAAVTVLELDTMRGEFAFIRLEYAKRRSRIVKTDKQLEIFAYSGLLEASAIQHNSKGYADTSRETSVILQDWALNTSISPMLRLQLAQESLSHATHSVCHAPSDSLGWSVLARSQRLLGFWKESEISMNRSQELTAVRKKLSVPDK